jgi:hypothetical protein
MPSDPLPPTYVNVPSCYVYSKAVPPVVKETFFQLLGLAWNKGYQRTEPYLVKDLADMFGKSPDTIWQHMRMLRDCGWLRFNLSGYSTYIFEFPSQEQQLSLFPKDCGNVLINNQSSSQSNVSQQEEGLTNKTEPQKRGNNDKKRDANLDHPAVRLCHGLTRLTPNAYQRQQIVNSVTNIDLWKETLEHWMGHGYSPMNVIGMVKSYREGGASKCRLCHPELQNNGSKSQAQTVPKPTKTDVAAAAFAARRADHGNGSRN